MILNDEFLWLFYSEVREGDEDHQTLCDKQNRFNEMLGVCDSKLHDLEQISAEKIRGLQRAVAGISVRQMNVKCRLQLEDDKLDLLNRIDQLFRLMKNQQRERKTLLDRIELPNSRSHC